MEKQLRTKAEAMCKANGVEFDESAFKTMFNNAKSTAVNAAVTGVAAGYNHTSSKTKLAFTTVDLNLISGGIWGSMYALSGHHSESSLNVRTLLDTFTENFKQNFSNWVEKDAKKKDEEK